MKSSLVQFQEAAAPNRSREAGDGCSSFIGGAAQKALGRSVEWPELEEAITKLEVALSVLTVQTGRML